MLKIILLGTYCNCSTYKKGILSLKYSFPFQETLRTALAMGVDRAIHVITEPKEYESMQPIHVSKILSKIATEEKADLVIVGKQVSESLTYYVCKIGK